MSLGGAALSVIETAERDLLSKAVEVSLGPGAGLEEDATLLVLILGCLGNALIHKDQKIRSTN